MNLVDFWKNGWAVVKAHWYLRCADLLGKRVRVWGNLVARNYDGEMNIGERVRIVSTIAKTEIIASNGLLEIGESTFINYGCSIAATKLVRIGQNCNIGTYVIMMDNDFHRLEPEHRNEMPQSAPIILEDNVWLGARVIVLRGVTIGEGSVIGAGSVVTKNIPPRSLAVGMPAKVVREL